MKNRTRKPKKKKSVELKEDIQAILCVMYEFLLIGLFK